MRVHGISAPRRARRFDFGFAGVPHPASLRLCAAAAILPFVFFRRARLDNRVGRDELLIGGIGAGFGRWDGMDGPE